ncbi:hypothetical protein E4U42_004202 [Claviceps africana]|uniref:Uncharacterized protein n=1 Tax=Claviceps africana TaxID=83212 RepID=A0A8K0J676_9HYPO|nr:hypothetical protein E4U42_004202 [Claviceps africana]
MDGSIKAQQPQLGGTIRDKNRNARVFSVTGSEYCKTGDFTRSTMSHGWPLRRLDDPLARRSVLSVACRS